MNAGDHPHFAPPRELHGKGADVARAAVAKDRLFLAQAGVVEQHLPCRHGDDGHRCGLYLGKLARLACDHLRRSDGVVGVPVDKGRIGNAEDLVSLMKSGHVGANLRDNAGNLGTQRQRQRQWQAARARSYQGIPVAYPRGAHANENFLVLRLRYVDPL